MKFRIYFKSREEKYFRDIEAKNDEEIKEKIENIKLSYSKFQLIRVEKIFKNNRKQVTYYNTIGSGIIRI